MVFSIQRISIFCSDFQLCPTLWGVWLKDKILKNNVNTKENSLFTFEDFFGSSALSGPTTNSTL
jgi:hypothetical protein